LIINENARHQQKSGVTILSGDIDLAAAVLL